MVSHEEFVKKIEKIQKKTNTNREKYRDKIVDQYNKVHKVDQYVIITTYLVNNNILFYIILM